MGSIKSSFKFESYKIDNVFFKMRQDIGLLEIQGNIDPALWKFSIKIREPIFLEKKKKYIGGLDIGLFLLPPKSNVNNIDDNNYLLKIEMGIAGIFSVEEKRFKKDIEDQLIKIQIPAILFPYIRGTLSTLLSNAGFGSVILPLINIHELAKKAIQEIKVLKQ